MSSTLVENKKAKPNSTSAEKLTAVAAVYSAAKLNALTKASEAIAQAQHQTNGWLSNIDVELTALNKSNNALKRLQSRALEELEKKNERDRLKDEIDNHRHHIQELRRAQEEARQHELQECKNLVHKINRETQLLARSGAYTTVEQFVLLQAMSDQLDILSADGFTEISDKVYLDETRDKVQASKDSLAQEMSEQDKDDLNAAKTLPEPSLTDNLRKKCSSLTRASARIVRTEGLIQEIEAILEGKDHLSPEEYDAALKLIKGSKKPGLRSRKKRN